MDNKKIGKLIASLRNKEGLTQQELGDKIGVGFRAVSKWERGLNLPDIGNMTELSKIFGITLDELMAGELKQEEKPTTKKKSSPKITITISIITAIIIIFTSIFVYYNNKTYVYDMVSVNKDEYYIEGQVTFKGNKMNLFINKLGFLKEDIKYTVITNHEYKIISNDTLLFGYGQTANGRVIEEKTTVEAITENFHINFTDKTKIKRKEIIKNKIYIIFNFLGENGEEIKREIKISLH